MLITIKNEKLTVAIDSLGAELQSIKDHDQCEYLWQGNPKYWKGRALNLFPYVARLTNDTYQYKGKEYHMTIHGFLRHTDLAVVDQKEDCVVFEMKSSAETKEQYPFEFVYQIMYQLVGSVLQITFRVENKTEDTMYFGIGGHPGFNVPLKEGLDFEDYYLEFSDKCDPVRVGFTPSCFRDGTDEKFSLENDRKIALKHEIFDDDAIVLKNTTSCVSIKSEKDSRGITVRYPGMPYVGFWHKPKMDAPYVCIEPWVSLPAHDGMIEDLEKQDDLVSVDSGKTYNNTWEIEVI